MRRLAAAALALALAPAGAQAADRPCAADPGFRCGTVTVPVDRAGAVPGQIKLFYKRLPARTGSSRVGVMLFPGGPGASVTGDAPEIAAQLTPALRTRQLVLLDARGTGRSGYIDCDIRLYTGASVFTRHALDKSVERCAKELGPRRAYYTTSDTVDDIEAVRQALGLDKLVLAGVSYGTRTALAYAARHPDRVESMVLDSVVPLEGPSPYGLESVNAVSRVLGSLCRNGGCERTTPDAPADLAALVDQIRERGAIRPKRSARFVGCRSRPARTRTALLNYLLAGDFTGGADRSAIPAFVRAAREGDANLFAYAAIFDSFEKFFGCLFDFDIPIRAAEAIRLQEEGDDRSYSFGLNSATYCEEGPMPWPRGTPPADRRAAAEQGIAHLPDSAFEPFDRATALTFAASLGCRFWPDSGRGQPEYGPQPDVPVLVVNGEEDLRTPLESARRVAGQFPRAKLLAVPDQGHSALGTPCVQRALKRFFAARAAGDCHRPRRVFPRPATVTELRCTAKVFDEFGDLLEGEVPAADPRCERVLRRYVRDILRDLADRRS